MQRYIEYLKGIPDESLQEAVENIYLNDSSDGKLLANNELVKQLVEGEMVPLAAFEKAILLEFIWRGLQIDQTRLQDQFHGDYGVDPNWKNHTNPLSTREMN